MAREVTTALALLGALALSTPALAVPTKVAYTGRLLDGGQPVNATLSITFELFDAASGGNNLWSENHASVVITDGVFSVDLGTATPLDRSIFPGAARWLETGACLRRGGTGERPGASPLGAGGGALARAVGAAAASGDAGAARAARAAGINHDDSVPIGLAGRHRRAEAWVQAALILCMLMFVCFVCAHTRARNEKMERGRAHCGCWREGERGEQRGQDGDGR